MDREYFQKQLREVETELNFSDGYQLLYGPWKTIGSQNIACISLNPSLRNDDHKKMISDERGNSYQVEEFTTSSPITAQILKMCSYLEVSPEKVLMGTICPFRSKDWNTMKKDNKMVMERGLAIGREFWDQALSNRMNLVIALGKEATDTLCQLFNGEKELEIRANYQNTTLKRFRTNRNFKIISLPHLSRFLIFSRLACTAPLQKIFAV